MIAQPLSRRETFSRRQMRGFREWLSAADADAADERTCGRVHRLDVSNRISAADCGARVSRRAVAVGRMVCAGRADAVRPDHREHRSLPHLHGSLGRADSGDRLGIVRISALALSQRVCGRAAAVALRESRVNALAICPTRGAVPMRVRVVARHRSDCPRVYHACPAPIPPGAAVVRARHREVDRGGVLHAAARPCRNQNLPRVCAQSRAR